MSTYLITGGAGFIGSHLVDALLAEGHEPVVLDDFSTGHRENLAPGIEVIEGSVTDFALLNYVLGSPRMAGCFHLAAISSVERCNRDWTGTHEVNSLGSVAVCNAARANAGRPAIPVAFASSAAIYGDARSVPLREDGPAQPLSAYGTDKLTAEANARIASTIHGVPTAGVRFFNVFGPRQDPRSPYSGVISIFARKVRDGEPLTVFGDGRQTRDFIYVSDAVRGLLAAMRHASIPGQVHNVCTGKGVTLLEMIEALSTESGSEPKVNFVPPRVGDIRLSVGDPLKAKIDLGFVSAIDFVEGLRLTLSTL